MPPSRPPTPAWLLLLLLLLAVTGHALAAWDSGHRGVARPGGTILPGSPQRVPPGDDAAAACFRACQADSRCAAWSVRVGADGHCAAAWCRLTADVPRQQAVAAATSTCDGAYTASGVRAAASAGLLPLVYAPVRLGAVAPAGWLRAQLVVMANGLSGALDEFWGDVNNSVWIGGGLSVVGCGSRKQGGGWVLRDNRVGRNNPALGSVVAAYGMPMGGPFLPTCPWRCVAHHVLRLHRRYG